MMILLRFWEGYTIESNEICYGELPKRKIGVYEFPSYGIFLAMLFQKFIKAECLVLDAGCGTGVFLKSLREGTYAVGLDIDRENIKKAMKRNRACAFVLGNVQYLPFRKDSFDFVCCRDVLEHVKNSEDAIRDFSFVLKEKGVTVISTTNLFCPWLFLDTLLPQMVSAKVSKINTLHALLCECF